MLSKKLNKKEKETIVNNILEDWKKLYKYKGGLEVSLEYNEEDDSITLTQFSYDHTLIILLFII